MATKKTTAPKEPAKKFGEVGFKFPIMVEIVEVNDPEDEDNIPFILEISGVDAFSIDVIGEGTIEMCLDSFQLNSLYSKHNPGAFKKHLLSQKQESLKQAKALVVKLEKEIEGMK